MSFPFWTRLAPSLSIGLIAAFCIIAPPRAYGCASVLLQQSPSDATAHTPPSEPKASFAQGQAALQSGDLAAAEAAFRRVLSVDPQSGAAYANLGVIAMRRKEWDHALSLLQKAEKLEPKM